MHTVYLAVFTNDGTYFATIRRIFSFLQTDLNSVLTFLSVIMASISLSEHVCRKPLSQILLLSARR